jgi:ribulose-bisphosphate carboxylase small chain
MRITQGTFSFLPDFTDEEIEAQVRHSIEQGWAISLEYTDDPHPRNSYWEMWGMPMFDLEHGQVDEVMRHVRECRETFPDHYVKLIAYDADYTRQSTALAFIVNRPPEEPGYRLERRDETDRLMRYTIRPYATDDPPGRRYGARSAGGDNSSSRDHRGSAG